MERAAAAAGMAARSEFSGQTYPRMMPLFVFGMSSGGDSSIVDSAPLSTCLILISRTFLCELECKQGTKVGLAAGRYSG